MVLKDAKSPVNSMTNKTLKHKRRFCCEIGCGRIVKSQGRCQRHGAKAKQCRIEGCMKQAQGGCDSMCKSHHNFYHPSAQCTQSPGPSTPSSTLLDSNHDAVAYPVICEAQSDDVLIRRVISLETCLPENIRSSEQEFFSRLNSTFAKEQFQIEATLTEDDVLLAFFEDDDLDLDLDLENFGW